MVSKEELEQKAQEMQYNILVRQSFDDFLKDDNIAKLFGNSVLQQLQSLEQKRKEGALTEEHVATAVNNVINTLPAKDLKVLDDIFDEKLKTVQIALSQFMQPRITTVVAQEQPGLDVQASPQFKAPNWTSKMDVADPRIRNAVAQLNNPENRENQPLTAQFDLVTQLARQQLREAYENKLKMKMPPPRPTPKPQDM